MKISNKREKILSQLEDRINYRFKDILILNTALTHSSFANESNLPTYKNNERLEFLGDAVLNIVVSDYLFKRHKEFPEGELTKKRAMIVCESSLAFAARKLNLGKYLLLGKGETSTGGRNRESILADTFEALIGSIYIDGEISEARNFLIDMFESEVKLAFSNGNLFIDYKTELQEVLQRTSKEGINYIVEKEIGPDHSKKFYMNVIIENKIIGRGIGKNKKEAEQMAAKQALNLMGNKNGN